MRARVDGASRQSAVYRLDWAVWASLTAISLVASHPVQACAVYHEFDQNDARRADVVAIAQVAKYRLVRGTYLARVDMRVESLLKGRVPATLSVTWIGPTSPLPWTLATGRYLIGLRYTDLPPSLRPKPDAKTGMPSAGSNLTVLALPCSGAFLFKEGSAEFKAFLAPLNGKPYRR